ncbi:MAG TPA: rhomboid family intramembrane serine protease [Luteibaculaceae bacterium]|nr:rhomboid family intramembrane serine protease [Luteibaculaceae bacterium]
MAFVALLWLCYALAQAFEFPAYQLGILPRTLKGLQGILTAPLGHADLSHLSGNSLPLLVLLFYIESSYPRLAAKVFIWSWLMTGFWVWISARESYHVGASGLVYALASFLFFAGVFSRRRQLMAVSLGVGFLYGAMVWGIFPIDEKVSWESHFWGAVAGFSMALYFRHKMPIEFEKAPWHGLTDEEYLGENISRYGAFYWDPEKQREYYANLKPQDHSGGDQVNVIYHYVVNADSEPDTGPNDKRP